MFTLKRYLGPEPISPADRRAALEERLPPWKYTSTIPSVFLSDPLRVSASPRETNNHSHQNTALAPIASCPTGLHLLGHPQTQ